MNSGREIYRPRFAASAAHTFYAWVNDDLDGLVAGPPGFGSGLPWLWRLKSVLLCCMEICLNMQCVRRSDKESCSGGLFYCNTV